MLQKLQIPIETKSRALRLLQRRRLAFASNAMGAWFGFRHGALRKSLWKRGIGPIPLGHPGWITKKPGVLDESALEPLLLYPMCIDLEATPEELGEIDPKVLTSSRQLHLKKLKEYNSVLSRAIECSRPGAVAIIQGYEPFNAVARELAIRKDLPVIAFENTALKDRMLWDDHSALTTNRNLSRNYYWRHLGGADTSAATRYCETLISSTKVRKLDEHASPDQAFEHGRSDRPNVLFLGQVYTDSSVIYGIGQWQTPTRLIRELARLAQELDFNLWIKLHPKEISGTTPVGNQPYAKLTHRKLLADQEMAELTEDPRIVIDHENAYDTYDMMSKADVAVTLNSQAGLEAAIRGVPTVLAGDAFYGGLGFTLEARSPACLRVQLQEALGLDGTRSREMMTAARVFTHLYFEDYCVPKTPDAVASLIAHRCFGQRSK